MPNHTEQQLTSDVLFVQAFDEDSSTTARELLMQRRIEPVMASLNKLPARQK